MSLSSSERSARWFDVWTCRPRFCDSMCAMSSVMSCASHEKSSQRRPPSEGTSRRGRDRARRTLSCVLYRPIMRSILSSSASASSSCLTTPTTRSSDSMMAWIDAWAREVLELVSVPRSLEPGRAWRERSTHRLERLELPNQPLLDLVRIALAPPRPSSPSPTRDAVQAQAEPTRAAPLEALEHLLHVGEHGVVVDVLLGRLAAHGRERHRARGRDERAAAAGARAAPCRARARTCAAGPGRDVDAQAAVDSAAARDGRRARSSVRRDARRPALRGRRRERGRRRCCRRRDRNDWCWCWRGRRHGDATRRGRARLLLLRRRRTGLRLARAGSRCRRCAGRRAVALVERALARGRGRRAGGGRGGGAWWGRAVLGPGRGGEGSGAG